MLNKDNERELAYIAKITKIIPIEKADNIELVVINDGWTCIAKKGEFNGGDLCVYFEIDSKLPATEWSAFLESKHYKVKTMKLGKFGVVSQGLALPASAFGWELTTTSQFAGDCPIIKTPNGEIYSDGDFLTKTLGVTYSVEEDNKRKANSTGDKYKKMAQRHPGVFQKPFVKWLYKRNWGKKLLFVFFGKKKDKTSWPDWVRKTDEERIQNMVWILQDKEPWFATEKIDGTSTTFTLKKEKGLFKNPEFYTCSRNVVFDTPEKAERCYYESNVYLEMGEKYQIEDVLNKIFTEKQNENPNLLFVTLQGETYGESIQKRDYKLKDHDFAAFNIIFGYRDGSTVRLNPREMTDFLAKYDIPCVPILCENYILPDTLDEILSYADGKSVIDGGMREGIVFRSVDGTKSFKAVSNNFLLKYHS